MFTPQINVYVQEVDPVVRFYCDHLGFRETYRYDHEGVGAHVEVRLEGLVLGFASVRAARDDHGLDVEVSGRAFEVVLFTDDVEGDFVRLQAAGATVITPPHTFVGRLRGAWLRDPWGGTVHIVQDLGKHPLAG